ncbi:hypothetical protein [Pseudomonas sp. MWU15-20650]|uniref:hypothetical protein n=1 Tax=Pseudomonas sp. MWU15-20650 TaxID=2933107 RepID=UPI00200E033B|nr:hypothetical protein [Pseudomonas sp. MWU15-20650]
MSGPISPYNSSQAQYDLSAYAQGSTVEEQAAIARRKQVEGMILSNEVKHDNNYSAAAQKRQ